MRKVNIRALGPLALIALSLTLAGCDETSWWRTHAKPNAIGDPQLGAKHIAQVGCGSCHIIPGISGARGLVGPPLTHMSRRIYIAGLLRNTPENLVYWIRNPQQVVPGNAMPNMDLSEDQARDIAAYLYTLE